MKEFYNFFFKTTHSITEVDESALIFRTPWKWYTCIPLQFFKNAVEIDIRKWGHGVLKMNISIIYELGIA